jgi:hypothetical protein
MGARKRQVERLADTVIYGTAETIEREFSEVLTDLGGDVWTLARAIETAREMMPLCECGADYHADLKERFPSYYEQTNREATV